MELINERLLGIWENVDNTVYFIFNKPLYGKNVFTAIIKDTKTVNVSYFLSMTGGKTLQVHININFYPFHNGHFELEFIDDNTIELTHLNNDLSETYYTLIRKTESLESVFEL